MAVVDLLECVLPAALADEAQSLCHIGTLGRVGADHRNGLRGPGLSRASRPRVQQFFDFLEPLGHERFDILTGLAARTHCDVLSIDRQALGEVATGPKNAPVRLTGTAPVTPEAKRHLVRVVDYVCRSVSDGLRVVQDPLISSTIQRCLAAGMLDAFASTAVLDTSVEDRRDSTPQLLRRAIAFIDDNAHTDISLADIANAIFVTPRGVQYMFRKHRDCTPTAYLRLRQVRLNHAHRELAAGNRDTTSVGDVARKWGFAHLGRFAAYYRQHYGQSPHVTLLS
ncbi:MAG: helix-turn-helix transcriptional regulator [Mycobacteriaceae bacterium]|nr:helix-turn-helix transcriptional regulator [Mycobacteriaceae bacterium]